MLPFQILNDTTTQSNSPSNQTKIEPKHFTFHYLIDIGPPKNLQLFIKHGPKSIYVLTHSITIHFRNWFLFGHEIGWLLWACRRITISKFYCYLASTLCSRCSNWTYILITCYLAVQIYLQLKAAWKKFIVMQHETSLVSNSIVAILRVLLRCVLCTTTCCKKLDWRPPIDEKNNNVVEILHKTVLK